MNETQQAIIPTLILLACSIGCAGTVAETDDSGETASRIWIAGFDGDTDGVFVAKSTPDDLALTMRREMSSSGWALRLDSVDVDPSSRRIVVQITEKAPEGMAAQVITPTEVEIPLGPLEPGAYFVEIWGRRAPADRHEPVYALVIRAR